MHSDVSREFIFFVIDDEIDFSVQGLNYIKGAGMIENVLGAK